jgi:predicted nuclease with TOPRIM domain
MNFDQTLDVISTILRNTDDLYAGQAHGHLDELQINHYNLINKHEALQAKYNYLLDKNERLLKEKNQLLVENAELEKRIEELE